MTLAIGNHVVKLDSNGHPLMDPGRESYVEFEIIDLSPTFWDQCAGTRLNHADDVNADTVQFAKIRKVR